MKRGLVNDLYLWQFETFSSERSIRHFITDRNSAGGDAVFTLGYSNAADKDIVIHNRKRIAAALGIRPEKLFFPNQVHQTKIVNITRETSPKDISETDALITAEPGIGIAVMSADCVPILLLDTTHRVVAAVHSGWRGTAARILEKTLAAMQQQFGSRGQDIIAGIGPSVCQASYEVGEEVINAIHNAFGKKAGLIQPQPDNKGKLDLWKANKLQLIEFGVDESRIEIANQCTVKNNQHFFSARRGDSGRFSAGIVLCH